MAVADFVLQNQTKSFKLDTIISNRKLSNEEAHYSSIGLCIAIKAVKFNLKMESIIKY